MSATLAFHGAAGMVTGSCLHCAVARNGEVLIDCGLFQGNKTLKELNWRPFPFDPRRLAAVLLTHAHIDHAGLIPRLFVEGFRGPVFATEATCDLCRFMLPDCGSIQEAEVERLNRRHAERGRPPVRPIYTAREAEACARPVPRGGLRLPDRPAGRDRAPASATPATCSVPPRSSSSCPAAGGCSSQATSDPVRSPSSPNAEAPYDPDWLVLETTYGDREREDPTPEERRERLRAEVLDALAAGGNLAHPGLRRRTHAGTPARPRSAGRTIAPAALFRSSSTARSPPRRPPASAAT
ncbi:MAG: MBL fold metallo-hydrolase [Acetobacteraceae bacterium]|nr:MBL fold metallo-hydrolase [Acetobacteraceae bacterium]